MIAEPPALQIHSRVFSLHVSRILRTSQGGSLSGALFNASCRGKSTTTDATRLRWECQTPFQEARSKFNVRAGDVLICVRREGGDGHRKCVCCRRIRDEFDACSTTWVPFPSHPSLLRSFGRSAGDDRRGGGESVPHPSGLKIMPRPRRPFITASSGFFRRRWRTQPFSLAAGCAASHSQSTKPSPASGLTVK